MEPKRVVCYLNQFFGQIGGEAEANTPPQQFDKPVGPAMGLQQLLPKNCRVVGTVVCGDDYFNEHLDEAGSTVENMLKDLAPHVVIAGPAFNAGRYGMACGAVSKIAHKLGIPAVSGMYPENPGVDSYRQYAYIIETSNSAAGMRQALPAMAKLAAKILHNEPIGSPTDEGYLSRGIRTNIAAHKRGSERAINMLLKKIAGEDFETEYPIPHFDRVSPAAPLQDLSTATIALVTSGGSCLRVILTELNLPAHLNTGNTISATLPPFIPMNLKQPMGDMILSMPTNPQPSPASGCASGA